MLVGVRLTRAGAASSDHTARTGVTVRVVVEEGHTQRDDYVAGEVVVRCSVAQGRRRVVVKVKREQTGRRRRRRRRGRVWRGRCRLRRRRCRPRRGGNVWRRARRRSRRECGPGCLARPRRRCHATRPARSRARGAAAMAAVIVIGSRRRRRGHKDICIRRIVVRVRRMHVEDLHELRVLRVLVEARFITTDDFDDLGRQRRKLRVAVG